MSSTWPFVILLILASVAILALLGVAVYVIFLSPDALRWHALRKQAHAEYEQARGTAHRRLMTRVINEKLAEKGRLQAAREAAQRNLRHLENERQQKLKAALSEWIVDQRLTEVSGIGDTLAYQVRREVFRGRLDDLFSSYRVSGVGSVKQAEIDRWIYFYQERFDTLLEGNFPGKQKIRSQYAPRLSARQKEIAELGRKIEAIDATLSQPLAALQSLQQVTEADFLAALSNGGEDVSPALDSYLQGVFAEWEPVPGWFRELMAGEESRA